MTSIPLPKEFSKSADVDSGAAKFSKKRRQLTISWPSLTAVTEAVEVSTELQTQEGANLAEEDEEVIIEDITAETVVQNDESKGQLMESKPEQLPCDSADVASPNASI